ncbi:GH92 family glycosyl hydrolase [Bacteroides bouchesdurhonensis]|uniref:GH92 family glycosyl hydrolase n=1 Tax=Bacteroides bouchesdurhonensis TaxID=1841855 RepID=UPI0011DCE77C|nr:GH92 family glycosyl hydrolase [Bacteroides bouchesdurhonensis]
MNKIKYSCIGLLGCLLVAFTMKTEQARPIDWVNIFIGTSPSITKAANAHGKGTEELGQTIPAVLTPNGMNSWTPQTRLTENKCVAPYYYRDSLFYGFRASHWINGGCAQDYGSYTIMGMSGSLKCLSGERKTVFHHEDEVGTPAYYSVRFPDSRFLSEMTATDRAAIFRYTVDKEDSVYVVITPNNDHRNGSITIDVEKQEIRGYNPVYRIYQGMGKPAGFSGHFVVRFDHPFTVYGVYNEKERLQNATQMDRMRELGAYIGFKLKEGEKLQVKAATSFTSSEAASRNLDAEIPGWNFEKVRVATENRWNKHLSSISVEAENETDKKMFYSALYRCSILPRIYSDVDGTHPAFSLKDSIVSDPSFVYYDDFSAWDTYRALMPLVHLMDPEKGKDMVSSLVSKYEQGGWLPIFPCWNSYTSAMVGDHAIAMIGDAIMKDIPIHHLEKAYEGMRKNAFESPASHEDYADGKGRRGLASYRKYGYIPLEDPVKEAFHTGEQVSRTLEYAYDDFVLSQVAGKLGKKEDAELLKERALNYRNVIDPITGYARGRHKDGRFIDYFNPFVFARYITEGYPCHYTWYVPQDIQGLVNTMGGKDTFEAKLDSMFSENRYWHGNEPCHQVAYLYNWIGKPFKTQQHIRRIMEEEYLLDVGGLSGNDDSGQMSAWYAFAALGFYPVCPGVPEYAIASPTFPKVTMRLKNGKTFKVIAKNASEMNIYIQSATLNGKPYTKNYLRHSDLMKGGTLKLIMGEKPSTSWGSGTGDIPYSISK